MQRQQAVNATALAVGSYSLIGWLLPKLFKLIGWIEWASGLSEMLALFADPRISWSGVYMFLAFAAASVGVVNNWRSFQLWRQRHAKDREKSWTAKFENAVIYITNFTYFGGSLPVDETRRIKEAAKALMEAANDGTIAIAGCRVNTMTQKRIRPRELRTLKLDYAVVRGDYSMQMRRPQLVSSLHEEDIRYEKLFFDPTDLEKTWPRKPSRF